MCLRVGVLIHTHLRKLGTKNQVYLFISPNSKSKKKLELTFFSYAELIFIILLLNLQKNRHISTFLKVVIIKQSLWNHRGYLLQYIFLTSHPESNLESLKLGRLLEIYLIQKEFRNSEMVVSRLWKPTSFSKLNVNINHLNYRFWLNGSGIEPEILHFVLSKSFLVARPVKSRFKGLFILNDSRSSLNNLILKEVIKEIGFI